MICYLHHAPSEADALQYAEIYLTTCKSIYDENTEHFPRFNLSRQLFKDPRLHQAALGLRGRTIMRRIVLAALLAAVAMPAWAANDAKPQPYDGNVRLQNTAFDLCKRTGTYASICAMKHVYGEDMALRAEPLGQM